MEYKDDHGNAADAKFNRLEGIGGWLRFLIVSLMILSPLVIFGRYSGEIQAAETQFPHLINLPIWSQIKEISWILAIFQASILIGAGFLLWKTRLKSTPKRVILMLWLGGPVALTLGMLAIAYISNQPLAEVIGREELGSIFGACISSFIWSIYLIRSNRVKNTYINS